MRGLTARTSSYASPSRAITPGRKFSTTTSAPAASSRMRSRICGSRRSASALRLFRLNARNESISPWLWPLRIPQKRIHSPPTFSILITSAPRSPSIWVAIGPCTSAVKSSTRTPASGPLTLRPRRGRCPTRRCRPASPPSTGSVIPVTTPALSLARKRTTFATSSGWIRRPIGCVCANSSSAASGFSGLLSDAE